MKITENNRFSGIISGLVLITAVLGAAALAGQMVTQGYFNVIFFGVALTAAAVMILLNQKAALVLIILGVFFFEFLVEYKIFPTVAVWTVDGLVLLLVLKVVMERRSLTGWFTTSIVFKVLVVWFLIVAASMLVNSTQVVQLILGTRVYFRFGLLAFCILESDWDESFLRTCAWLVLTLLALQVPITGVQVLQGMGIDNRAGTLSSTGISGVVAVAGFGWLFSYGIASKKWIVLLPAFLLLLVPVLGTARAFLLITPLAVIYLLFRLRSKVHVGQLVFLVVIVGAILINWDAIQGSAAYRGESSIDVLRSPMIMLDELFSPPVAGTQGQSIGRFAGIQLAWSSISGTAPTLLFGYGPASAQGSRFADLQSSISYQLALSGGLASQFTRSLLEWGVLGLAVYIAVLLMMLRDAERSLALETEPFWWALAMGAILMAWLMLATSIYTTPWAATSPAFLMWFAWAALERHRQTRQLAVGGPV